MPRRAALLGALIASFAIAACSSTPAAPALTDPKEILTKSVEALAKAKSFHITATVSGTFNGELVQPGMPAEIKLDGTTLEGDFDITNKNAQGDLQGPGAAQPDG